MKSSTLSGKDMASVCIYLPTAAISKDDGKGEVNQPQFGAVP
jgi:hypothetical protein